MAEPERTDDGTSEARARERDTGSHTDDHRRPRPSRCPATRHHRRASPTDDPRAARPAPRPGPARPDRRPGDAGDGGVRLRRRAARPQRVRPALAARRRGGRGRAGAAGRQPARPFGGTARRTADRPRGRLGSRPRGERTRRWVSRTYRTPRSLRHVAVAPPATPTRWCPAACSSRPAPPG